MSVSHSTASMVRPAGALFKEKFPTDKVASANVSFTKTSSTISPSNVASSKTSVTVKEGVPATAIGP